MSDEEIDAVLAEMRAAIAEIRGETSAVHEQLEATRLEDASEQDGIEEARRNGDHGREWQLVQQSIDLGRTTLEDVISGVDLSPEAKALRLTMQKTLPAARAEFAAIVDEEAEDGAFVKLQQAQAELARAVAELNRLDLGL